MVYVGFTKPSSVRVDIIMYSVRSDDLHAYAANVSKLYRLSEDNAYSRLINVVKLLKMLLCSWYQITL